MTNPWFQNPPFNTTNPSTPQNISNPKSTFNIHQSKNQEQPRAARLPSSPLRVFAVFA